MSRIGKMPIATRWGKCCNRGCTISFKAQGQWKEFNPKSQLLLTMGNCL